MKPRRPLRRSWLNRHAKPREHRDQGHGFKDPRSRVLWRTGRVILKGADKTDLRRQVYNRAEGRCEEERNGKRCGWFAPWDGIGHGELSHVNHGANRDDTEAGTIWSCSECHARRHPGLQFSNRVRAEEAGADSQGPT